MWLMLLGCANNTVQIAKEIITLTCKVWKQQLPVVTVYICVTSALITVNPLNLGSIKFSVFTP